MLPMGNRHDAEIEEGLQEYFDHKNPVFGKEHWRQVGWPTLFDLRVNLEKKLEDFEDNTPLDEEGNLCVERFWDRRTGKIKKDMFRVTSTFPVGKKTYSIIYVPWSNAQFIVDFGNKKGFPWMEKWLPKMAKSIDSFWDKEIVIFGGFDDVKCIANDGKQIWDEYVDIKKIPYWKIDILEFTSRANPDEPDDLRTKKSYLWSDGKRYKQVDNNTLFETES